MRMYCSLGMLLCTASFSESLLTFFTQGQVRSSIAGFGKVTCCGSDACQAACDCRTVQSMPLFIMMPFTLDCLL
jgi:hypothetical protein